MQEFLKFFDEVKRHYGDLTLEIYYSNIMDYCITVGYYTLSPKHGEKIIYVQSCDMEYAFAKAHVELKDWLSENKGGY